jgi:hypothetical protein
MILDKNKVVWVKGNHQVSLVDVSSFEESKICPLFGNTDQQVKLLPLKAIAIEDIANFGQSVFFFGESYERREYFIHYTENIFDNKVQNKTIAKHPIRTLFPEITRLNSVAVFKRKSYQNSRPVLIVIGCKSPISHAKITRAATDDDSDQEVHQISLLCLTLDMNVRWFVKFHDFGVETVFGGLYRDYDDSKIGFGD